MLYLTVGLAGLVWLYFWLTGNWFAAVVAALVLGGFWFMIPPAGFYPAWWATALCFAGPWIPLVIRYAWADYTQSRLSLRLR
jgi:hypothetical protein